MRDLAAKRIMSISFERDPAEHADMLLAADRRFMQFTKSPVSKFAIIAAIGFGLAIGLLLELYRRYVLPLVLDSGSIPPLPVILFQLIPFLLLIAALILGRAKYIGELRKQALASELDREVFIDSDIYENGIETTSNGVTVWMPWAAVRSISLVNRRIEIVGDIFVAYMPERAFSDRGEYETTFVTLTNFWQNSCAKAKEKFASVARTA